VRRVELERRELEGRLQVGMTRAVLVRDANAGSAVARRVARRAMLTVVAERCGKGGCAVVVIVVGGGGQLDRGGA
jgi:hypothetical protein